MNNITSTSATTSFNGQTSLMIHQTLGEKKETITQQRRRLELERMQHKIRRLNEAEAVNDLRRLFKKNLRLETRPLTKSQQTEDQHKARLEYLRKIRKEARAHESAEEKLAFRERERLSQALRSMWERPEERLNWFEEYRRRYREIIDKETPERREQQFMRYIFRSREAIASEKCVLRMIQMELDRIRAIARAARTSEHYRALPQKTNVIKMEKTEEENEAMEY